MISASETILLREPSPEAASDRYNPVLALGLCGAISVGIWIVLLSIVF
ncbi:MAG: hypothetical protein AAFR11_08130 [Pseudomonadota bacterium]